jgi:hypothetical protein
LQRRDIHDWEENISRFIASLHGRLLITKRYSAGNGNRVKETPMAQPSGTTAIAGRLATDNKELWVAASYLREWCDANGVPYQTMVKEMVARSYVLPAPGKAGRDKAVVHQYLTAGTTLPSARSMAMQINYAKVEEGLPAIDAEGNVVKLPTRSNQADPGPDAATPF